MHKLECSAMTAFEENWCPSEISRLVARILAKKVGQLRKERQCPFDLLSNSFCGTLRSFLFIVPVFHRKCRKKDVLLRRSCS